MSNFQPDVWAIGKLSKGITPAMINLDQIKKQIADYAAKVAREVQYHESYKGFRHVYVELGPENLLTGTTSVIGVRQKEFLKWWTVKIGVKYLGWFDPKETKKAEGMAALTKRHEEIRRMSPEEYYDELDAAKKAHSAHTKKATDAGTAAHDWCETYIKNKLAGRDRMTTLEKPTDPQVLSAVYAFLEWERAHQVIWLASEFLVWHPEQKCAGTIDFLAIVDGVFTLGDFKTSSVISEEVCLQTAAYYSYLAYAGIKPEQRMVVRIPKDASGFEYAVITTPLEFDVETFYHLREVKRWNGFLESSFQDTDGHFRLPSQKQQLLPQDAKVANTSS